MFNILTQLFYLCEFKVESENFFAYNDKRKIFYVYKNYYSIDDLKRNVYDDQNDFYEYISSLENSNEIKKNTSFIILVKLSNSDEKHLIQEKILDLEEDKYFFKKYVITYLDKEIDEFKKEVLKYDNIVDFIEKSVNDPKEFEKYKKENEVSYYSLILKLYIKIPHLVCRNIFKKENIINLKESIIHSVENQNLLEYYNKIICLEEKNFDEYIEKILIAQKECK